jgi:hypothetical protein
MDYEKEPWMKVYTRDTGGWSALHIFARGLALEIGRKLDAKGELSLGRKGLPALAAMLRAPSWEVIEPYVAELLSDCRFVFDVERSVLLDPEHSDRQRARTNAATRKRMERDKKRVSRDVTRSHTASRDVTNRSEEIRSEEILAPLGSARAPESSPTAPEPEPEMPPPAALDAPPPLTPPDWFEPVVEAVVSTTGEMFEPGPAWLAYSGHRRDKRPPKPTTAPDALYWLTSVWVRDIKAERESLQRRVDREAKWDQQRRDGPPHSGLQLVTGLVRDDPKLARERARWAEEAGPPEDRRAAAQAALAALGGA